jgi:transcriptional regulator with XRE-family HTH domain
MARDPAKPPDAAVQFGKYLRALRESRSLSLRQVARLATRVAKDSAGRVSHSYVSQVEGGLPVAITLAKLLSLAAVYNMGILDIIAHLPGAARADRARELIQWQADQRGMPEPIARLPGKRQRSDNELDELFAARAHGFTVDWQWKMECEREARGFLPFAVLLPLTERSAELIRRFWAVHQAPIPTASYSAVGGALGLVAESPWNGITDSYVAWASRETEAITEAVGAVSWWTLDFKTSGASCHFADPAVDARYGFDQVPPGVVIAVRRWQLARLLSAGGAPAGLPPLPRPIDGARQFVQYLLRPRPFDPEHAPEPLSAAVVCTSLAKLAELAPALCAKSDDLNLPLLEAVASLINRAAGPIDSAETPLTRPFRRRGSQGGIPR